MLWVEHRGVAAPAVPTLVLEDTYTLPTVGSPSTQFACFADDQQVLYVGHFGSTAPFNGGIYAIDVSTPSNITLLDSNLINNFNTVAYNATRQLVSGCTSVSDAIFTFDVSTPSNIVQQATTGLLHAGFDNNLFIDSGDAIVVPFINQGPNPDQSILRIYDINPDTAFTLLGSALIHASNVGPFRNLFKIDEDNAGVYSDVTGNFYRVDINPRSAPTVAETVAVASNWMAADNTGGYVYGIDTSTDELLVYTVPTLTLIDTIALGMDQPVRIAVDGNYAVIASNQATDNLMVVDITNRAAPVLGLFGTRTVGTVLAPSNPEIAISDALRLVYCPNISAGIVNIFSF
jgi:hypothetical protein